MNLRTLKRQLDTHQKRPGAPRGTTGRPKGPARVSRKEYVALLLMRRRIHAAIRRAQVKEFCP